MWVPHVAARLLCAQVPVPVDEGVGRSVPVRTD